MPSRGPKGPTPPCRLPAALPWACRLARSATPGIGSEGVRAPPWGLDRRGTRHGRGQARAHGRAARQGELMGTSLRATSAASMGPMPGGPRDADGRAGTRIVSRRLAEVGMTECEGRLWRMHPRRRGSRRGLPARMGGLSAEPAPSLDLVRLARRAPWAGVPRRTRARDGSCAGFPPASRRPWHRRRRGRSSGRDATRPQVPRRSRPA